MPCKVIDVAKNSFGRKLFIGLKMTLVPLGFTTYNYNPRDPTSLLTSNENIIRMRKIAPLKKENNRAC
jgi:hypothetical protein